MSWERDPLWAKARLFFERAFNENRDDPAFGLWCSLGLELLARAALASVSPALLAEPDNDHRYLLHAIGRGSERFPRRSIATRQVFYLCRQLFGADFTDDDVKAAMALANRRNDELHTGAAAFDQYRPKEWLPGFYRVSRALVVALGESLESLFGDEEAAVANETLVADEDGTKQRVRSEIAAFARVFGGKPEAERHAAAELAQGRANELARQRHHRVECPACKCSATVQGRTFGNERTTHEEGVIRVRQAVYPTSFSCSACGLKLTGYAELNAADLGGHYTRTTEYAPEEYYGLINPDDFDPTPYIEEYLRDRYEEYDNEV
jgi:hypothetical protein